MGLEFVDNNTAVLYHQDGGQTAGWNYLCLNDNCTSGTRNNGRFERTVSVTPGNSYKLEFKVQDNAAGQCLSGQSTVSYDQNGGGVADTACK